MRITGEQLPAGAWSRRQAASLVKILALAPRRQLHREQVVDALWPAVPMDEVAPRLHKAAHFARRVLGPDSLVLRNDVVFLFPETPVTVDVARFEDMAGAALTAGDASAARVAADVYGGELLPDDR